MGPVSIHNSFLDHKSRLHISESKKLCGQEEIKEFILHEG